jgi:hypothetical protein
MSVPMARLEPRNVGERIEAAVVRTRYRANRITTNRITRSGWFVGLIGAVILSPFWIWLIMLALVLSGLVKL